MKTGFLVFFFSLLQGLRFQLKGTDWLPSHNVNPKLRKKFQDKSVEEEQEEFEDNESDFEFQETPKKVKGTVIEASESGESSLSISFEEESPLVLEEPKPKQKEKKKKSSSQTKKRKLIDDEDDVNKKSNDKRRTQMRDLTVFNPEMSLQTVQREENVTVEVLLKSRLDPHTLYHSQHREDILALMDASDDHDEPKSTKPAPSRYAEEHDDDDDDDDEDDDDDLNLDDLDDDEEEEDEAMFTDSSSSA